MVRCTRWSTALRAASLALGSSAGRVQQQHQVAAKRTDRHHVTKTSFMRMQQVRHKQARRSVLVMCSPQINEGKFLKYMSQFGEVAKHFFFGDNGTQAVVEFVDSNSLESFLSATKIPHDQDVVPYKSRCIRMKTAEVGGPVPKCWPQSCIPMKTLMEKLCNAKNIEDQMLVLLNELQLTEESIRLRYLVSSLMRDLASAYFPNATVELYGSSVNTFGKMGCDLDLFLNFQNKRDSTSKKATSAYTTEFWMKRLVSGRSAQQKILSVLGECIDTFGPGCYDVHKILNARCPVVRFTHQFSGLQCDLTTGNEIALRTSELLYLYGNLDHRVRALVFTLRCWARVHGITSSIPGHWITNFSITMMVLFFLQKRNPPIIPTLDHLRSLADCKSDELIINEHDCTFVRTLTKIGQSENTESLDKLLIEFLEFYGKFDFKTSGIDIRRGAEKNKPEDAALYIQNPFEQALNISKNVNQSQVQKFVTLAQESAFTLQDQVEHSQKKGRHWGLASILLTASASAEAAKYKESVSRIGSLLDSLKINKNASGKKRAGR